uniref:Uncharacterized protein n=1 Tax=Parascaris univalens TaxID=6257 RepID=A0A915BTQ3_PARUN
MPDRTVVAFITIDCLYTECFFTRLGIMRNGRQVRNT